MVTDGLYSLFYLEIEGWIFFWQLAELQNKVRSEVSSEYWLRFNCMFPDKQLFDWGMMRLPRPLYGIGDAFSMEADDQFRKKRDAEVSSSMFIFSLWTYLTYKWGNFGIWALVYNICRISYCLINYGENLQLDGVDWGPELLNWCYVSILAVDHWKMMSTEIKSSLSKDNYLLRRNVVRWDEKKIELWIIRFTMQ